MGRYLALWAFVIFALFSLSSPQQTTAQTTQIQEFHGYLHPKNSYHYHLPNLKAGDTLYVLMENVSGNLDPFLMIHDEADSVALAEDDDSGSGNDAQLTYLIPEDSNYTVTIHDCCQQTFGEYRLVIGLNAPQVLAGGSINPSDEAFAFLNLEESQVSFGVEEHSGTLASADEVYEHELTHLNAGHTLQIYIEGLTDGFIPHVALKDFADKVLIETAIPEGATAGSFEYAIPESGDHYDLLVSSANQTSGDYRLQIGIDAPEVLEGDATPIGDPIIAAPRSIQVGAEILQITSVDQKAKNFSLIGVLRVEWTDHAYAFDTGDCECAEKVYFDSEINVLVASGRIRIPTLRMVNQNHERSIQNRSLRLQNDGHLFYEERFDVTLDAPNFDFRAYPFDTQDFWMLIESSQYDSVEHLEIHPNPAFSKVDEELGEAEWKITRTETSLTMDSRFSEYRFDMKAKRHLSFYIYRVLIPLFLLTLMGWVIFFLDNHDTRISAASGNLFVFLAFNFTVGTDLPRLGYMTFLEALLIFNFLAATVVFMITVYLKRLAISGDEALANKLDRALQWGYPVFFIIASLVIGVTFL